MPPDVTMMACALQCERTGEPARACRAALRIARLEDVAAHAVDRAAGFRQRRDAMAKAERDEAAALRLAHAPHERLDHARPGAPGDVKARHRIAVPGREVTAAFGPADDRENFQALRAQPRPFLARREIHIGLGPAARPVILIAVEAGRAEPILQRKVARVAHAHAALLGRVDEEQPAERPEGLAAERAFRLLIENDDLPARVGQLSRGDQTRKPGADHNGVCVHARPRNDRERMLCG